MKIVFMGTPEFAVPSLRKLAQHHEVVAVFCQPDRPKGRGKKLQACPVKETALALGIPVHQPKRIKARKWVTLLAELAPDLAVVAAFGQLLSQKVLDVPRLGCVNVHASLLPRWRGASPIHHAIVAGDPRAGVGIMKMVLALDAGPVYAEASLQIDATTRREQLETELAELGAELLVETLPKLTGLIPEEQDEAAVTYAPIIDKEMGYVDPTTQTAQTIDRNIRAFEGWPATFVYFRELKLKLVRATPLTALVDPPEPPIPGAIALVGKKQLILACADHSALRLEEVQIPGKKVMPIHAFINGYQPKLGESMTRIPS